MKLENMVHSTLLVIIGLLSLCTLVTGSSVCELCSCTNTTVNCSDRSLDQIPDELPKGTTQLILANNQIKTIPNLIFNNTQLIRLDLSNNSISRFNFDSFYGLDSLETLLLPDNTINLENKNYPYGVFRHLKHLKRLDLSSNIQLTFNTSYPHKVFGDLVSLSKLKIDGIPELIFEAGFAGLKQLIYLNLTGHCYTTTLLNNTFVNVPNLQVLILSQCRVRTIDSFAFTPLKSLTHLDLSCNQKLGLNNAAKPLKNIKTQTLNYLDLSAIELLFTVGVVLKASHAQSIHHLNLTHFFLDHNRIEFVVMGALQLFPKTIKYFSFVDNKPTFGLYLLNLNQLENVLYFDYSQQYTSHAPFKAVDNSLCRMRRKPFQDSKLMFEESTSIHKTNNMNDDVRMNKYTGVVFDEHVTDSFKIRNNSKNFNVGLSHQPLNTINFQVKSPNNHPPQDASTNVLTFNPSSFTRERVRSLFEKNEILIPIPSNVIFLNSSSSKLSYPIPRLHFQPNKVQFIDLSFNVLSKWNGPIVGANHLEWLDLSNNYCDYITEVFFNNLYSLKHLKISSNFLSTVFEKDTEGKIFSSLENLETLDISDNKIRYLPNDIFKSLISLRYLLMANNPTKIWTINLEPMTQLEYIDASDNLLTSLPNDFRSFCDKQHQNNKTLSVNLLGQRLQCTCDNLDFLKWMQKDTVKFINRHKYLCTDEHGNVTSLNDLDEIVLGLEKYCASYTTLIVVLTCGMVFLVGLLCISLVYRYRWKLRYVYYLTRAKYRSYSAVGGASLDNFDFDAFVSYANEDVRLVKFDMVNKLEQLEGLKLCIHDREFLGGENIAANILNAARNSKKTVILLSKNFLASYWCIYELNMAYMESVETGRNVLIVIVYEHVPVGDLPEILIQLMKNDSYIEYTDDPQGNILFWDNLGRAIKAD